MFRLSLTTILIAIAISLSAQKDSTTYVPAPIEIIGKHKGSEILLRWAYSSPNEWLQYRAVRFDLYRRAIGLEDDFQLVKEDVGVVSEAELEQRFTQAEESVGMAAVYDAYYGDWQTSEKGAGYGAFDKKDELESKYLILHYACDLDFSAAEAAGLGYRDTNVATDQDYMYRLQPKGGEFSGKHRSVTKEEDRVPIVLSEWAENEGQVTIAWSRLRYEDDYTGYYIEKSTDGTSYQRVNDLPYVHVETEDVNDLPNIIWQEAVANYQPAYYRVRGIDAFAELSKPSNSVRLMGRDRTPAALPFINKTKLNDDQTEVDIEWEYLEEVPADLDHYVLRKSYGASAKSYKDVAKIDGDRTSYADKEVSVSQAVYYKLCAVDTAQNYSCTDPVYTIIDDKIAPAAPQSLAGSVDTNGVVTLTWDLGKEPDLLGYYVQVSNGRERVFVPVTDKPLQADHWHDTIPLDVLTEEIYYRVVAVDLRYNTSEFSEVVQLLKPDIVPPTPSVFDGYKVTDDGVQLSYLLSRSRDVVAYTLIREGADGQQEVQLSAGTNFYFDDSVAANEKYRYTIVTIDDAGHETPSPQELLVHTKDAKQQHDVELTYQKVGDKAQLTWTGLESAEVDYVKIYRGSTAAELRTYKSVKNADSYETNISALEGQTLRVRIHYKDGAKSAFSNVVQVL